MFKFIFFFLPLYLLFCLSTPVDQPNRFLPSIPRSSKSNNCPKVSPSRHTDPYLLAMSFIYLKTNLPFRQAGNRETHSVALCLSVCHDTHHQCDAMTCLALPLPRVPLLSSLNGPSQVNLNLCPCIQQISVERRRTVLLKTRRQSMALETLHGDPVPYLSLKRI